MRQHGGGDMNAHYDETPIENQKWQFKYGLKNEIL